MKKQDNHKRIRTVCLVTLCVAMLIGVAGGLFAFFSKREKTQDLSYVIGGLNEDGSYKNSVEYICSKEFIECMGLDIQIAYGNNISYRVFFYDKDKQFLSSTEKLTGDFADRPELARYCRLEIKPNDDILIKQYEVNGYAKQLSISVDEKQKFTLVNYFESGKKVTYQIANETDGKLSTVSANGKGHILLNCKGVKGYSFIFAKDNLSVQNNYYFVDENKNVVSSGTVSAGLTEVEMVVPEGAVYFYVNYTHNNEFIINKTN